MDVLRTLVSIFYKSNASNTLFSTLSRTCTFQLA